MSALRALESTARHLSYTRAAEELHVTQSAISHQIRHIESLWDVKLFERRGRGLQLTEHGQALVPIIRDFLRRINSALDELHDVTPSKPLRVTTLQSFASKWLVPRLGQFNREFPDIEVWISTSDELADFSLAKADVGIRLGYGNWPELYSEKLLNERVFPVCSTEYLEQHEAPRQPAELLQHHLLRRSSYDICPRWRDWFRDAGVRLDRMPKGTQFPETSMAIQAALDHQGIALARSAHVVDDLRSGRLISLFNDVVSESDVCYYFVCPYSRLQEAEINAFKNWLAAQAALSQTEFNRTPNRLPGSQ